MYEVVNRDSIYTEGYWGRRREYQIRKIGDESALIRYLANAYKYWGGTDYSNDAYNSHYFDGYGRDINARAYEADAWLYYLEHIKGKVKNRKPYSVKNKVYYGVFREIPVSHTGRYRGGPSIRPRKIKHIVAMYGNPEYKEFNRGSHKELPDGWWDDWTRSVERNWKSQRKVRHQWQR